MQSSARGRAASDREKNMNIDPENTLRNSKESAVRSFQYSMGFGRSGDDWIIGRRLERDIFVCDALVGVVV
jgi:hypothetical protein